MSPELERQLVETFPTLFADHGAPPDRSPMAFGFECGDGWFDLIETLCAQLSRLEPPDAAPPPVAQQVKDKYGTLRFYVGPCADAAQALTAFAEALSAKICETCGNKGRTRGVGRLKTLCEPCALGQGYIE